MSGITVCAICIKEHPTFIMQEGITLQKNRYFLWIVILCMGSLIFYLAMMQETSPLEAVQQLRIAASNNKLIVVVAETTDARVYAFEKQGQEWREVFQAAGFVGRGGIGDAKTEGDGKTPAGVYAFGRAFGVGENPGSLIPYTQLTGSEFWVDDPNSPHYNMWVNGAVTPKDWNSAEDLYQQSIAYKYGLVIEYNTASIVRGAGSGIFLHCSLKKPTSGCVSVPEPFMIKLLRFIDGNTQIVIARSQEELKKY